MALTFDATDVRDFDSLTEEEKVTYNSLIWATMTVGINRITVDNARDFFARLSFSEKVNGPSRYKWDEESQCHEDLYFTQEEVLRFVGLRTNASPLTLAKFRNNCWELHDKFNVPKGI